MSGDPTESGERQAPAGPPVSSQPPDVSIDAFVSYASHDVPVAHSIVEVLEGRGLRCWIAPRDVTPGSHYADHIMSAISRAKVLVLVLSDSALASNHVGKEVERASSKGRPIIALRTDATALTPAFEYFLSESQWIDVGAGGVAAVAAKLVEAVRRHADSAVSTGPVTTPAAAGHAEALRLRRWMISAVAVVFAVVFGYLVVDKFRPSKHAVSEPPVVGSTPATAPAAPRTAIAVMPFANLTGDPSKDYLGDGMSEELINVLTKVPGLTVPSRTSSFAYKGRNTDLRQIGKDLRVGTILEGSVRSAGTTIRITAQLIDANSDRHLWSETYDRKFTDIFKLQDELATAIATALRGTVGANSFATVRQAPPTKDVEAYQLYLQARSLYLSGSEKHVREALSMLNTAITRDPGFARAWAARAGMRVTFATLGYTLPNALADAKLDAERALALDANLPEALVPLGTIDAVHGDWIGAEKNFQVALTAKPGDADVVSDHVIFVLQTVGQLRKAEAQAAEAYRLAPADRAALIIMAALKSLMGIDADAIRFADLAVNMGYDPTIVPIPQVYANAAVRSGHYAEAAERTVSSLPPTMRDAGGAEVIKLVFAALADPSKKSAARQALRDFVHKTEIRGTGVIAREDFIVDFVRLGALDDAYELASSTLDDLARSGTVGGGWGVLWMPEMRPFRQDPRFQKFAARLKLFDYWEQYGPPDACDLKDGKLICH